MIYLDYSANTPVQDEVLNTFVNATKKYIGNPNSSHHLGKIEKEQIDNVSNYISKYFNCSKDGVIYTGSASEANNLVIKGIANRYKKNGNHIIISAIEHSSVIAPCSFLTELGYEVSVIPLTSEGVIDIDILKNTINDNTILVSICSVDSELGTIQPIEQIGNIVKNYKNCFFHTDATQAIGKINIVFSTNKKQIGDKSLQKTRKLNFSNVDFITFSPHKFYGLNGLGVLINRNNVSITPLIHGGKSTTIYRSSTPDIANICALDTAFKLATNNIDNRYLHILELNTFLRNSLLKYSNIHINSPINSIPHILNFSTINQHSKDILDKLSNHEIYVSNNTACSLEDVPSRAVLALTNDNALACNTIRVSLSHLNTMDEIIEFLNILHKLI